MIGRLVHSADFQRLLATPAWSRSAHFAVHHLAAKPGCANPTSREHAGNELSTDPVHNRPEPVDDLSGHFWLGAVLPKRLARRAVTRNLLRRQIRGALQRHGGSLPGGLWVVRLRSAFTRAEHPSAASDALRMSVRRELDQALGRRRAAAS